MSYYIKRIITITENPSKELYEKLESLFREQTGFSLNIFDDHLDDSGWNFNSGISAFIEENEWADISEKFGDIPFKVHCISEDNAIYDYYCQNGCVQEDMLRETDAWYKIYQDKTLRSPGARQGYYEDPGFGNDYPILYGNKIPVYGGNNEITF